MGTGKSAVGAILAKATGRTAVEMDAEIEKEQGMSINDIFAQKGEPYFRALERQQVQALCRRQGLVLSTGGGVVLDRDNMRDFKTSGAVICLAASPETVYARVKDQTHRPLLKTENPMQTIKELMTARAPFYALADATVSTDGKSPDQVAEEVLEFLEKKK